MTHRAGSERGLGYEGVSTRSRFFFPFFSLLLLLKKCGHPVMKEREKSVYNNAAFAARVMLEASKGGSAPARIEICTFTIPFGRLIHEMDTEAVCKAFILGIFVCLHPPPHRPQRSRQRPLIPFVGGFVCKA